MRIPLEIQSRLQDSGYMSMDTVPVRRVIEECEYVLTLLANGGTTYDDDPVADRNKLAADCRAFLKDHKK